MAITIFGPQISTYVRSVRLVLEEKAAAYEVVEVDILNGANKQPEHLARQPFGRVPSIDHDGFGLYETGAIVRYLDRALPGVSLTPSDVKAAARMDQFMGILDAYAYDATIQKLVIQRVVVPMLGGTTDEAVITAALPTVRTALGAFEQLASGDAYLVGAQLSLADLMLVPVIHYLHGASEGAALIEPHTKLRAWWAGIAQRPSVTKTEPRLG